MKLIGFGPGEICDRLSILALKILHANGQPIDHFTDERDALVEWMVCYMEGQALRWLGLYAAIAATNSEIWRLNHDLRQCQEPDGMKLDDPRFVTAGMVALRQQVLNDRRAELIAQINQQAGHLSGPEKL